jgi:hypothetical protein
MLDALLDRRQQGKDAIPGPFYTTRRRMGYAVIAARKSSEAEEEPIATDRRRLDRFLPWLWPSVHTQTEASPTVGGPMFAAQNLVVPAHGSGLRPARGQAPPGTHDRNGSRLSGQLPLFRCSSRNLQRAAPRARRKSWASDGSTGEITANGPLFCRCFRCFWAKDKIRDMPILIRDSDSAPDFALRFVRQYSENKFFVN